MALHRYHTTAGYRRQPILGVSGTVAYYAGPALHGKGLHAALHGNAAFRSLRAKARATRRAAN